MPRNELRRCRLCQRAPRWTWLAFPALAALVFGEVLSPVQLLGGLLVLGAVVALTVRIPPRMLRIPATGPLPAREGRS